MATNDIIIHKLNSQGKYVETLFQTETYNFLQTASASSSLAALTGSYVKINNFTATGTPSSSTYLRGDNTWAIIPSGVSLNGITNPSSGNLTADNWNIASDGTFTINPSVIPSTAINKNSINIYDNIYSNDYHASITANQISLTYNNNSQEIDISSDNGIYVYGPGGQSGGFYTLTNYSGFTVTNSSGDYVGGYGYNISLIDNTVYRSISVNAEGSITATNWSINNNGTIHSIGDTTSYSLSKGSLTISENDPINWIRQSNISTTGFSSTGYDQSIGVGTHYSFGVDQNGITWTSDNINQTPLGYCGFTINPNGIQATTDDGVNYINMNVSGNSGIAARDWSIGSDGNNGGFISTPNWNINSSGVFTGGHVVLGNSDGTSMVLQYFDNDNGYQYVQIGVTGVTFTSNSETDIFSINSIGTIEANKWKINEDGVFIPKNGGWTTSQINAMTWLPEGSLVYNKTLHTWCFKDNTGWRKFSNTAM